MTRPTPAERVRSIKAQIAALTAELEPARQHADAIGVLTALGFTVWSTGGGCECYGFTRANGSYMMVTNESELPQPGESWDVGIYPDANEDVGDVTNYPATDITRALADIAAWRTDPQLPTLGRPARSTNSGEGLATDTDTNGADEPETGTLEHLLCDVLLRFCEANGLACQSADEMLHARMSVIPRTPTVARQVEWLSAYCELWDASEHYFGG